MFSSLLGLVDELAEGLYKEKCKNSKSNLEDVTVSDGSLILKYQDWNKNYKKEFDEDLVKRLQNTYKFCDRNINKFFLLLQKGIDPYEHMDSWQRFSGTSLPNKEEFYDNLAMENIIDADYKHVEGVWEGFTIQNLGDNHYLQSETLLLTDVFESFRSKCTEKQTWSCILFVNSYTYN